MPAILALDHVQLAIPRDGEDRARAFYVGLLGLLEASKPAALAGRGGLWLVGGSVHLHLGVEEPFTPARKAHPAFLVDDLDAFRRALSRAGHGIRTDQPLAGYDRCFVDDPFGNRIELMQRVRASGPREA